jgi:HSP20 family protein
MSFSKSCSSSSPNRIILEAPSFK